MVITAILVSLLIRMKTNEYPRMPCKLDGLQVCNLHFPEYILDEVRRCN